MRLLLSILLLASLSAVVQAQPADISPTGVSGHHVGETASAFLAAEPRAQRDLDSCHRKPSRPECDGLLAAFERGERAEISTSDSSDFVFDQGKLIKLATLLDGAMDTAALSLTKALGPRTSEIDIQKQDPSGAKWHDNLSVWSGPDSYVMLFEDNNPSLNARHLPVLVVESPAEHARNASDSAKKSGSVKRGLQKILSKSDPDVVSLDF